MIGKPARLPAIALLLALAFVGLPGGGPRPATAASLFNPQSFSLPNGMQVVVIEDRRAPVLTHMVWYKVGAADEPPGKSGIAHFLEHLMFKGTPAVPPGDFSRIIARNGGRDNAFTSHDYTGYFQDVASDKLELVMRLEADRMVNLMLSDDVVTPERQVILEERRSRIDNDPAALLSEQASAALFLNHHYGIPVIGWKHEMEGLTRDDAIAFYRAHYAPNNALLVVVGDVETAVVRGLAEQTYGKVAQRELKPRMRAQEPPQLAARRVVMEDLRVRVPAWNRTYLAPSYTAGESGHVYALTVLAEVLGGGATSRLNRALVLDDGVASGAGAWYDPTAIDLSRFGVYARPRQGGDVAAVEAAADKVIAEVLARGIDPAEMERAKAGLIASAVYTRDSVSATARLFGAGLSSGLTIEQIEGWPERIRAVTREQVDAAARAVLEQSRSVTSILLPKPAS